MKRLVLLFSLIVIMLVSSGCFEKIKNRSAREGSFFYTSKENHIIISQSGGYIMDIYKLENTFVESSEDSDGWNFVVDGNSIMLGGDVKIIRINNENSELWDMYNEYHIEFESLTYQEKFGK